MQTPIRQCMATNGRIGHEHSNLAVVRLGHCDRILTSHPRSLIALLGKACIIEDYNAVWGAKRLAHKALVLFNAPLVIPRKITQNILELPGRCGSFLGNILHGFSLKRHHQALQIFFCPRSDKRNLETACERHPIGA